MEQIAQLLGPQWQLSFYRTAAGAEMDVVAERSNRRIGFEIKFSSAPTLSKGCRTAIADLKLDHTYVVAPVEGGYPLADNIEVVPAAGLATLLSAL